MFRKNVAGQFIHFQGVDSATGGIKSAVTWTVRRCLDGTFAAATGTVTEDGTTGWYKFAMSQADTNGNNIGFNFTGTGAIPQTVNLVTTACDPTSTAFGLSLAKTTNITGFNDIAATAIVSGGAITTSGGAVSTVTTATNVTTVNGLAANVITAAATAADFGTEIASAVWDMDATAHQTGGTFGQAIGDPGADTNTIFKAVCTDATGATVGVDVAAVLADTGTDGVVVAAASKSGYSLTATTGLGNQTANITGSLSGSVGSVTGAVGSVTANVNAVLINGAHGGAAATAQFGGAGGITSNLTGNVTGSVGSVTGLTASDVGAIKAKTDQLTFTVANQVDANAESINATAVLGTGAAGDLWRG